jgi:hypothetical protein
MMPFRQVLGLGIAAAHRPGRLLTLRRFADHPPQDAAAPRTAPGRGERGLPRRRTADRTVLAAGAARDTRLAFPLDRTEALVAGMVDGAPPRQLQALISSVTAGYGLHLYISN